MNTMRFMMLSLLLASLGVYSTASGNPVSDTDAWQYTNIQSISTTGLFPGLSAYDMFGASLSTIEPSHTVFKDGQATGYVHSVQWALTEAVTIGSFNLLAAHDGAGNLMTNRGFDFFKLEAYVENQWINLYQTSITPQNVSGYYPVYGGGETYTLFFYLEIFETFSPVTAQTWRASFTQYGGTATGGPRIMELDGFEYIAPEPETIPEPASCVLIVLALAGLLRRKFVF